MVTARRRIVVAVAVAAALHLPAVGALAAAPADHADTTSGRRDLVVRLHADVDPADVLADLRDVGGRPRRLGHGDDTALAVRASDAALQALRTDPRVAAVESDHPVRAFGAATGVERIGTLTHAPADIDGDGSLVDVDVAVLDTGVDGRHPDLRVTSGVDCLDAPCAPVSVPTDPNGHGTHVAGIVGARDDGAGVVGVAPGARIHSVRILDAEGSGSLSSVLAGLQWVLDNADTVEVANLSLGCECRSQILDDLVDDVVAAGVTLVVAAGNTASDAATVSPANHPDVLAVGAVTDHDGRPGGLASEGCIPDGDDTFASYSNHGSVVDLVAPGSCIISTLPGGYGRRSGTSMAAPHVAGAAALHVATTGLAAGASRAAAVRRALLTEQAVPADDACGYTGAVTSIPLLQLTCDFDDGTTQPDRVPEVTILGPVPHASLVTGRPVRLVAEATDADGRALDTDVTWWSDRDGGLGTGGSVQADLSAGTHSLVATVTDDDGAMATHTLPVSVADPGRAAARALTRACPSDEVVATSFDDLARTSVFAPAVDCVAWWGVAKGVDEQHYGTSGLVTRGQMAAFLARLIDTTGGTLPVTATDHYTDDDGSPFEAAINRLAAAEIVLGTSETTFSPAGHVTRAQMATFLRRVIEYRAVPLPQVQERFTDVGAPHGTDIEAVTAAGIAAGTEAGSYLPGGHVSRGQMAAFLGRTLDLLVDLGVATAPS